MTQIPKSVLTFLCLAVFAAPPTPSQAASFQGLGVGFFGPSPGFESSATGVSADGSVVVGENRGEAFRWKNSGGMVGLGLFAGQHPTSTALGVSADGSTIVGSAVAGFPAPTAQSFQWKSAGGLMGGPALGSGPSSAEGVSADGSVVVGGSAPGQNTNLQAFRWTMGSGAVGLGTLGGDVSSDAAGVSADGSVVVGTSATVGGTNHAFRWTASIGMVGLGVVPGETTSQALGISADGKVVVGGSGKQAFRWTAGSGMVGLGILPGDDSSVAAAVSADGSVVVGSDLRPCSLSPVCPGGGQHHAMVWDAVHGLRSLQQVLMDDGVNLSAWTLTKATSISADGNTIVGDGLDGNTPEAWIAVIPEPGTGLLVMGGVLGLGITRRTSRGSG
ncbi:MAG TPA: PEP-CTERM sorting domain-containing protein [Myxococcota bacterium]|nr:PEP-CTERM sorting domain-containing protein [Myxococcota bacterium]